MKFPKKTENPIFCLCWRCGGEIRKYDKKCFVNEEIWCEKCAATYVKMYVEGNRDE